MQHYNNFSGGSFDATIFNPPKTTTTPSKSGFDYAGVGLGLVNTAGTIYASEQARKGAIAQANALIAQGVSAERVQQLILEGKRLDLETAKAGVGTGNTGGNKTLYIALGIGGVVILGLVIFAVTRKKS
jgi:hypothetical protein